jgi:diphthamide biosynthesis protein 2
MAAPMEAPPVLSTPDNHIFEDPTPPVKNLNAHRLSDEELYLTYEIERTVKEIRQGQWQRVALQFPDEMLVDAPRVFEGLERCFRADPKPLESQEPFAVLKTAESTENDGLETNMQHLSLTTPVASNTAISEKLYILADTSYGSCCVDEVAAEHVSADVVIHYGRSCLSPTSHLPVIYVFTSRTLPLGPVIDAFKATFPDKEEKIVLMADVTYSSHILQLRIALGMEGYNHLWRTEVIHDPSSPLPNRTVPEAVKADPKELQNYSLFHISNPPTSLLLILSSRLANIHIYPTDTPSAPKTTLHTSTSMTLRRRYALITSLTTTPIFGILINTLSVSNYQSMASHVQEMIRAAGKKSYTFVVGKVNAAKVANFSEIGGWVVIGCWESSLIESKEFYRPIITPWELAMVLQSDERRVWTGEWVGDFNDMLFRADDAKKWKGKVSGTEIDEQEEHHRKEDWEGEGENVADANGDYDSEPESAPPEYDLRSGRYISHSRPLLSENPPPVSAVGKLGVTEASSGDTNGSTKASSGALTRRGPSSIARVGNAVSPGAEYLKSQRTWTGLGSDFHVPSEIGYEDEPEKGALVEEGRRGIAKGYVVGDKGSQH